MSATYFLVLRGEAMGEKRTDYAFKDDALRKYGGLTDRSGPLPNPLGSGTGVKLSREGGVLAVPAAAEKKIIQKGNSKLRSCTQGKESEKLVSTKLSGR